MCGPEFMLCFLKQRGCETTRRITCPRAAVGKMENELTSILIVSHVPYAEMYSSACFVGVRCESHETCQERFLPKA